MKKKIYDLINEANNIVICSHIYPDGDSIGSSFGLALTLKKLGKKVAIYKNDEFPKFLDFLYREDVYLNESNKDEFEDLDLFISLDSSSIDRIEGSEEYFNKAKTRVCIDHHITNTNYCDYNYVLDSSSACEIVASLMFDYGFEVIKEAATYFYLGILTDTNRFNYQSSNSNTLRVAADLLDLGADKELVHDNLYETLDPKKLIFEADMVKNATYIGDKIVVAKVRQDELDKYDLSVEDVEGLVSLLRTINGIEVSAVIKDDGESSQKISFRSHSIVDVSKIALEFGGGGHVRASGASVEGTNEEVFEKVVKRLEQLYESGDLSR